MPLCNHLILNDYTVERSRRCSFHCLSGKNLVRAKILQMRNSQFCKTEQEQNTFLFDQDSSTATYDQIRMDSNCSKFSPACFQLRIDKVPCLCLWVPCLYLYTAAVAIKRLYGSVSAGREFWLFRVTFFFKVEPSCDQT